MMARHLNGAPNLIRTALVAAVLLHSAGGAYAEYVKCGSVVNGEIVSCPENEDECCVGNRSGTWGKYRFVNGAEVPEGNYCDLGSQAPAPRILPNVSNPQEEGPVPGGGRRAVDSGLGVRFQGRFPATAEPPLPRDLRLPRPGVSVPRGAEGLPPAVLRAAPKVPEALVRLSPEAARTFLERSPQVRASYRDWYCHFFVKTDSYCAGWQARQPAGL